MWCPTCSRSWARSRSILRRQVCKCLVRWRRSSLWQSWSIQRIRPSSSSKSSHKCRTSSSTRLTIRFKTRLQRRLHWLWLVCFPLRPSKNPRPPKASPLLLRTKKAVVVAPDRKSKSSFRDVSATFRRAQRACRPAYPVYSLKPLPSRVKLYNRLSLRTSTWLLLIKCCPRMSRL